MIFIGLTEEQKQREILRYAMEHDIKTIIVFSDEKFFMELPDFPNIRQIGYKETIMYRTFYPLLAEIGDKHLLVMNEMMRDRNRSCLTYNCVAKYTNQTPHRLVFEWLPCMDSQTDMMILLDFNNSQQYKGRRMEEIDLCAEPIQCVRRDYRMEVRSIDIPDDAADRYGAEKERLFDTIGSKDPDTIPRQLHLWCGKLKAPYIEPGSRYVARNARFKRENVTTYPNVSVGVPYIMLDIQHSRKQMNDYFRMTQAERPVFLSTGLSVDRYYVDKHKEWVEEVKKLYAETGVYSEDG